MSSTATPTTPVRPSSVACTIRYRLDGSGPAAFLVDCEGELRVYARGGLGGVMPRDRVMALLAERGCRWVPAVGALQIDLEQERSDSRNDRALPGTGLTGLLAAQARGGPEATAPC